jgi:hypothetical protein
MQDYQRYTIIGCIFPACMSLISYTWYMIAMYISCRRFLELCAGGSGIFCQSWSRVGKLRQKLLKTKLWKIISYFNELLVMEKLSWMIWSYYKV